MDAQVRPEKMKALQDKMERLGIFEKDLIEKFVRSGGKGGQKVNKASSCVYLKHLPTGVEVKCQQERYQSLNRFLARRLLADKIESLVQGKLSREEQEREKIRRQKRRRSRRAQARMLENKRIQSEKKVLRSKDYSLDE
jgi:protein subunit release factor B